MSEQVFISYSSLDRKWAIMIADHLEKNGIHCWIDREGILTGERYDDVIMEAIDKCPLFLLVLSENAEASTYVPKELGLAITAGKHILPVQINSNFKVKRFRLKLENIQIFELGKSWDQQRAMVLTDQIKLFLDLVPAGSRNKLPEREEPKPVPAWEKSAFAWKKYAIAACAVAVLFLVVVPVAKMAISHGPGGTSSVTSRPEETKEEAAPNVSGESAGVPASDAATQPASDKDKPTRLTDMHMMEEVNGRVEASTNSVGQNFEEAVSVFSWIGGDSYVSYYLGGEYSLFTGTISCPDVIGSGHTYTFEIYLDGNEEEPALEMEMSRSTAPTPLSVDVSGCESITIAVSSKVALGAPGVIISDGLLYGKDADLSGISVPAAPDAGEQSAPVRDKPTKLTDMHMMEEVNARVEASTNSVGQEFEEAVSVFSWIGGDSYVSYYLGGEYSLFTGTVSCPDAIGSGHTYTFEIYLDGNEEEPVVEMEMSRSTAPTPLSVDVSGCGSITIAVSSEVPLGAPGAIISDGLLYGKDADLSGLSGQE